MTARPSFSLTLETPVAHDGKLHTALTFHCPRRADFLKARRTRDPNMAGARFLSRIARVPIEVINALSDIDANHIELVIGALIDPTENADDGL